jgi:hypothetical protein
MKTKIMLIALAFGLMSSTCSSEDQPQDENLCECQKVYYDYGVTGWQNGISPIWGYTKVGEEQATQMGCDLDTGEYIQIDSNSYYKIECE